jgi:hypothetical protein
MYFKREIARTLSLSPHLDFLTDFNEKAAEYQAVRMEFDISPVSPDELLM